MRIRRLRPILWASILCRIGRHRDEFAGVAFNNDQLTILTFVRLMTICGTLNYYQILPGYKTKREGRFKEVKDSKYQVYE